MYELNGALRHGKLCHQSFRQRLRRNLVASDGGFESLLLLYKTVRHTAAEVLLESTVACSTSSEACRPAELLRQRWALADSVGIPRGLQHRQIKSAAHQHPRRRAQKPRVMRYCNLCR